MIALGMVLVRRAGWLWNDTKQKDRVWKTASNGVEIRGCQFYKHTNKQRINERKERRERGERV